MTTQELKEYINKTLGNSIRCLLPSYWLKRLFGLVVDKVEEIDAKVAKLPTKKYVDNALSNVDIAIDGIMSDTSSNPVQNKVVKEYIDSTIGDVVTFIVGVDDSDGKIIFSEDDMAHNQRSFLKIYNKIPTTATLSIYVLSNSNKLWLYTNSHLITSSSDGYGFINIKLPDTLGRIICANQPVNFIFTGNGETLEMRPYLGLYEFSSLFLNTSNIASRNHNKGVYEILTSDTNIFYNIYNAVFFAIDYSVQSGNNIKSTQVFPARYTLIRDTSSSIAIVTVYIEIIKNNFTIKYELNSDGTLTEISNTSILNQE